MSGGAANIYTTGDGTTYRLGGIVFHFKHPPAGESGAFSVCEAWGQPGSGAGLHRHAYEEWHIVLEGTSECILDGERSIVGPGAMVHIPSGVPHGFRNTGTAVTRQILLSSPPGLFEGFVAEVAAAQVDSGSPSRPGGTPDFRAIAQKHGIEFIDD
jgi:mannose-6-phosphate isomerase-like protein (cupin superfamily)